MISVTAAIIIKNNKVLIAQRKSYGYLANKWEFPGGKIEQNETPEDCLIRELKEEFSIDIKIQSYFGQSIYQYPDFKINLIAYKVIWVLGDIKMSDHQDYNWVPIDKLDKYDFASADIPLVNKLKQEFINGL